MYLKSAQKCRGGMGKMPSDGRERPGPTICAASRIPKSRGDTSSGAAAEFLLSMQIRCVGLSSNIKFTNVGIENTMPPRFRTLYFLGVLSAFSFFL